MKRKLAIIIAILFLIPCLLSFKVDEGQKIVYLTFDDGPNERYTPQILSILEKEKIKATFFVIGTQVDTYPDALRDIYKKGHKIGIHSYSHKYSEIYSSPSALLKDIYKCKKSIQKVIPAFNEKIYRFPSGSDLVSQNLIDAVVSAGFTYYDWNCYSADAEIEKPTKSQLVNNVKKTFNGSNEIIVLLHDLRSKKKYACVEALEDIIIFFKEKGYQFKTL